MQDIIVIGAGFAGMTAARELRVRGFDVTVLEARDRVGGRVKGQRVAGVPIDVGAQWRGPTQDALDGLLAEFRVGTAPQYATGRRLLDTHGQVRPYRGLIPPIGWRGALETGWMLTRFDRLTRRVPLEAPWRTPRAAEWDAMSVAEWARRLCTPDARAMLGVATNAILSAPADEVSFLYFLYYLRAGGGFGRLADVRNGAQQDVLQGGMHGLAYALGASLESHVMTGAPVECVEQTDQRVRVHAGGRAWDARRVIVAVPPALALEIEFRPQLPARRTELLTGMPMGSVIKVHVAYPRPFWRDAGLTGEVLSVSSDVTPVFDATPPAGRPGILVAFIEGDAARRWSPRTPAERRALVVRELQRFFGPLAAHPIDSTQQDWLAATWTRGCYVAVMPPNVLSRVGNALRAPFGRVHWAGTETATVWVGYVDGAVRSGRRAAREVAGALAREGTPSSDVVGSGAAMPDGVPVRAATPRPSTLEGAERPAPEPSDLP